MKFMCMIAFYSTNIYCTLKQIAPIIRTQSSQILLHLERVQMQSNSVDCGVYVVAFKLIYAIKTPAASCQ